MRPALIPPTSPDQRRASWLRVVLLIIALGLIAPGLARAEPPAPASPSISLEAIHEILASGDAALAASTLQGAVERGELRAEFDALDLWCRALIAAKAPIAALIVGERALAVAPDRRARAVILHRLSVLLDAHPELRDEELFWRDPKNLAQAALSNHPDAVTLASLPRLPPLPRASHDGAGCVAPMPPPKRYASAREMCAALLAATRWADWNVVQPEDPCDALDTLETSSGGARGGVLTLMGDGLTVTYLVAGKGRGWFVWALDEGYSPGAFGIRDEHSTLTQRFAQLEPGGAEELFVEQVHEHGDSDMGWERYDDTREQAVILCAFDAPAPVCHRVVTVEYTWHGGALFGEKGLPELDDAALLTALDAVPGELVNEEGLGLTIIEQHQGLSVVVVNGVGVEIGPPTRGEASVCLSATKGARPLSALTAP